MDLKTKIFLDSSDIFQTKEILQLLGFLDGQTTNPSLVAKNLELTKILKNQGKLKKDELLDFYKKTVIQISQIIPNKSVSIEVYADKNSSKDELLDQAKIMQTWILDPQACHIKLPTTKAGLEAATEIVKNGGNVNMTLVFEQEQAAAVHKATLGSKKNQVLLSPFIGRLNDQGKDGTNLISNIQKMYQENQSQVQILAASIRSTDQLIKCLELEVDIITAPFEVLKDWADLGKPSKNSQYETLKEVQNLKPILYQNLDMQKSWDQFNIQSELTDKGLQKFVQDWTGLIQDENTEK